MIFKQINELLSGKKTATRRIAKPGEFIERLTVSGVEVTRTLTAKGREKYRTGRPYSIVPKLYQPAITTHKIVFGSIRLEHLHDITEADAIAEGVASVAEYRELWKSINGPRSWDKNPWVFVYGDMTVVQPAPTSGEAT